MSGDGDFHVRGFMLYRSAKHNQRPTHGLSVNKNESVSTLCNMDIGTMFALLIVCSPFLALVGVIIHDIVHMVIRYYIEPETSATSQHFV